MNCPYCNMLCVLKREWVATHTKEFTCHQVDHEFWQQGEMWFLKHYNSKLIVNAYGIRDNNLKDYFMTFEELHAPELAIPKLQKTITLKAFI